MVGDKKVELTEEERVIIFDCLVNEHNRVKRERGEFEKAYLEKLKNISKKIYTD